ncbi:MAG: shikimate kinase AroL [Desulfovibrio sp.]|nr:shikimate kinase AroL [Desulfovibrio sp.]
MGIVFLVGGRGAGKTTVGRALARELSCAFTDMDDFLCARAGMSVADIVAAEGWEGFRARECAALREAAAEAARAGGGVIATGGGAVLDAGNRDFLRANGVVVWLSLPPEAAAGRLAESPLAAQRPSLTGKSMLEEVREVMGARAPLYAACAHHTVDAALPAGEVCAAVLRHLPAWRKPKE